MYKSTVYDSFTNELITMSHSKVNLIKYELPSPVTQKVGAFVGTNKPKNGLYRM